MTEQQSDHTNFNKEELPIPIPPVDQAWQSMQQKLDMELPVVENLPSRPAMRHIWIKTLVITISAVTAITALWLYSHKHLKNAPSSENIVDDTSLIITSQNTPSHRLSNTVLQQSAPSAINNISDERSDTVHNNQLWISSSSSRSLPSSSPSAELSVPPRQSVNNKQYPSRKNTGHPSTDLQTTHQQETRSKASDKRYSMEKADALATAAQQITTQQPLPSPASDQEHPVEKTAVEAQQRTTSQQLPAEHNTYTSDHSTGGTTAHHPLQLTLIKTPFAKYNTSLQHKAAPLVLRQFSSRDREKKWALYIQLNIPVPLYRDSIYFVGPNGKDQFYRNLVPALRVERKLWEGALSLDILPAVSSDLKSSIPAKDSGTTWFPFDTSSAVLKQYGWGLALQYQFLIHNKWQIGAGVQTSFLQKTVVYRATSDTFGHTTSGIYPALPAEKQDLSKVRINAMAELNYVAGRWQLGLRTLVPITRVSKTRDISARPLNMEFIIRRRLWAK
ncbi:hypothetical protein [Chitinophaga sp. S165]|uniref:hypothetical protein n=1 Tax=Chitinophaga sp. S165 TaxID=2135462 RepID=UPI000D92213C|nr:hypothetical protein [Chitinophaga sp. S165]PWV49684.1 hypothetical protein C7475_105192 [Chitinophaga sp. S165]